MRGYRLAVDRSLVDQHRFQDLVAKARASDAASAVELLRTALSLWRGPALVDFSSGWLPTVLDAALKDERLAALDERAVIDLRAGAHDELVTDLSAVVAEHPLRERSVSLLMTRAAPQRPARADAIALFNQTRRRLVEDLGVEPGEELQHAYKEILESTPAPTTPPATLVPQQLPADTAADPVGRAHRRHRGEPRRERRGRWRRPDRQGARRVAGGLHVDRDQAPVRLDRPHQR